MARINRDDIDKFFEYGLYLPTRTVYLGSAAMDSEDDETGTDYAFAANAVKSLHILDAVSQAPITVVLNSSGGDITHGMAVYDAIRACRSHVTVTGTGSVMSMGSIILQAGDVRQLTPSCTMMIHQGSMSTGSDTTTNLQRWTNNLARWDREAAGIYLDRIKAKHPGYTLAKVRKLLHFDTLLTAEEAVDMGLADSVTVPPEVST